MWQLTVTLVAGVSKNYFIPCTLSSDGVFWLINGFLYGPLQVPRDFIVCSEISCDLDALTIPVAQSEMDGSTLQCVIIDYNDNTQYRGEETVLDVTTIENGIAI